MSNGPFAFVRNLQTSGGSNLKTFSQIKSAAAHAKRLDKTSQKRQVEGRNHENNYFWSKAGKGLEGGGADYEQAYKRHKSQMGVTTERKGAAIGQHLLVGVSPEWLAEAGDPRDLDNPRVQKLIAGAKEWAESWMGLGAVWAVRYDTDEKGAGVVDILASPIRTAHHKSGTSKPSISVRKANAELAEKWGARNAFVAMQDDWAAHAQQRLSKSLQRGEPKRDTQREHLTPEAYQAALSAAPEVQEAEKEAARILKDAEEKAAEITKDAKLTRRHSLHSALRLLQTKIDKLEDQNEGLTSDVAYWTSKAREFESFVSSVSDTLGNFFGERAQEIKNRINSDWSSHPDNPTKASTSAPSQSSSNIRSR